MRVPAGRPQQPGGGQGLGQCLPEPAGRSQPGSQRLERPGEQASSRGVLPDDLPTPRHRLASRGQGRLASTEGRLPRGEVDQGMNELEA